MTTNDPKTTKIGGWGHLGARRLRGNLSNKTLFPPFFELSLLGLALHPKWPETPKTNFGAISENFRVEPAQPKF